jgi:DNA-directed RNA polymerases I, II, and III subunit RPABC2
MDQHPEVRPIYRKDIENELIKTPGRTTRPYFTKYEYTVLLATRAQQLADGSKPLVDLVGLKMSDPMFVWVVAKREILQRKLPFLIRRQMPNGSAEYWSAQEMEIMW